MEGSYSKVWGARNEAPAEEYKYFVDSLMGTIRRVLVWISFGSYYLSFPTEMKLPAVRRWRTIHYLSRMPALFYSSPIALIYWSLPNR